MLIEKVVQQLAILQKAALILHKLVMKLFEGIVISLVAILQKQRVILQKAMIVVL